MALKRKRSTPSIAGNSPLSTNSYNSTSTNGDGQLPFIYAQSKPVEALYQKPTWSSPTYESDDVTSSHHLGSRTRKRHRDDRPHETSIHGEIHLHTTRRIVWRIHTDSVYVTSQHHLEALRCPKTASPRRARPLDSISTSHDSSCADTEEHIARVLEYQQQTSSSSSRVDDGGGQRPRNKRALGVDM